ncbi:AFR228Wp [Eremothecium gossypii ATCC 10895]|uniref:AFR228Wp n=1 Tax=Eremothecium gossypii (strain ATCC 10895 / CBS 109.51 / FGSC 9923 / NRRL Y-1056) TaxID=284811 RepID=Q753U7_EREGS|nr:AFR228Wp [Eremothecium gossypii ATCC 10895]AAS53599.1 AFR228Wp [Eremothecium gossypii ATCC 10895]AEY97912.1 FAFR228Wp [Eremothecium gossypii FDAG1]
MNEEKETAKVNFVQDLEKEKYITETETLQIPTEHEELTLRRIVTSPKIHLYFICLIEFAERGSFYGTGNRMGNFYQYPLPIGGNGAGAPGPGEQDPGALGKGLAVATAMGLLLKFTSYTFSIITGYISDVYIGQIKMLWIGVWLGVGSHILFIIAALPSVLAHTNVAYALSVVALLSLSLCTSFVKPVLLPLLLQQYPYKTNIVKTLLSGERVIVDRDASLQRMTMVFYWAINVGAFLSLATAYSAQRVGYWLAFTVPLIIYLLMPIVLWKLQEDIKTNEPSRESVLAESLKVLKVCYEWGWIKRYWSGQFWDYAKPTNLIQQGRIGWRKKKAGFYDEKYVYDTKLTISACTIFLYYVIYQMHSNLDEPMRSQAGSMEGEGVPNDLFSNFNPISIIVVMPILDYVLYPLLRRYRINFKPVYRIFCGFMIGCLGSTVGAIIQWRVYNTSPCGYMGATTCPELHHKKSPLSRWLVAIEYALGGTSECLAMTTGYEIAFERSPKKMKGFVLALFMFTVAISSAIILPITPFFKDPYLIQPFAVCAGVGALTAIIFLWRYWDLDKQMKLERELSSPENSS